MKAWSAFWGVGLFSTGIHLAAEESLPLPTLAGIVHFGDKSQALLEFKSRTSSQILRPALDIGESVEGWTVTAIDEASATVSLRGENQSCQLSLPQPAEVPKRALNLHGVALGQFLEVYQRLAGTTVLRDPACPEVRIDLATGGNLPVPEVITSLNEALAAKGINTETRRGRYVFALRSENFRVLQSIADPPVPPSEPTVEAFAPGMLRFHETDVGPVIDLYQELSGRTLLRPSRLPGGKVTVRNQTGLNRAEAAWLLEAVLRLGGIKVVSEGVQFAFAVPVAFPLEQEVPRFNEPAFAGKIQHQRPPAPLQFAEVAPQEFLALYADLVGRKPQAVPQFVSRMKFSLRSQGALTQSQSIYALEALAALSYCRLQFTEGGGVELAAGPGLRRPAPPGNLRVTIQ